MQTTLIALALASTLASTSAADPPIYGATTPLDQTYMVCKALSTVILIDEQETQEEADEVARQALERELCQFWPKGLPIVVRRRLSVFACIGPRERPQCAWTVYPAVR